MRRKNYTDQNQNTLSTGGKQQTDPQISSCQTGDAHHEPADCDPAMRSGIDAGADAPSNTETSASDPASKPHVSSPVMVGCIERRPADQLRAYARNARTHSKTQIDQIAASIQEFGFVNPILIGADNVIIAGHARLKAARKLGMHEIPVIVVKHLSEAQRSALVMADNRLALNAGWDEELLRAELAALSEQDFNLDVLGFDEQELTRLLAEQQAEALRDPDEVPSVPDLAVTMPGDLWVLGDHRLLCGDATSMTAINTTLAGARADMVFTDPPCEVGPEGTNQTLQIENNVFDGTLYECLRVTCANLIAVCDGAIYICMASSEMHMLYRAFTEAGGHWSTFVIWDKHLTFGRSGCQRQSDYRHQYEPILYGWRQGGDHFWCGARNEGDVWMIPQPAANGEHPSIKPVELVERAIENSSQIGDIVLDPFAGSGSTLNACERRKRRARLIEIDPRSVDVICQRWQQFSGKPAVLDGDGRTFQELADYRQKKAA